ncbi:EamA-like transporter family protein [Sporobacter termitidis DSM 10068]|uniref:EamA-like transporter family protein n=1 Tax=Sporobacter termitidis DSM 10068 TaxID=1123282 RepID=A0A1M5X3J0_9FIRM|nr:EamA family transporter [Sporobacter termitidis]SHH94118.1 EamA-like transporter family protein [Sporobacter termitidis DSM 10068]
MWNMLWPILIVVAANTIYNISAKSTPTNINSFASLSVTYLIAMTCSIIMYFVTSEKKNLLLELSKANWTTYALGIAIVGLEFGFLCVYRAGWKISTANLFASITLACVLLIVGFLLYKETLSLRQVLGMGVCAVGLVLIAK